MSSIAVIFIFGLCTLVLIVCVGVGVAQSKKKQNNRPPDIGKTTPRRPAEATCLRQPIQPEIPSRQDLILRLSRAQQKLEQIAACKPYIKLFGGMALPLQILLGLEKSKDEVNSVFLQEYFYERVVREIQFACNQSGFRLASPNELIPPPAAPSSFDDPALFPDAQLPHMIRRYESEAKGTEIDFIQRDLVAGLSQLMWELSQVQDDTPLNCGQLSHFAKEATTVLEQHQIYPMYQDDARLSNCPELLCRFAPSSSILYPGLFFRNEGKFVVLGSYIGTRKGG